MRFCSLISGIDGEVIMEMIPSFACISSVRSGLEPAKALQLPSAKVPGVMSAILPPPPAPPVPLVSPPNASILPRF